MNAEQLADYFEYFFLEQSYPKSAQPKPPSRRFRDGALIAKEMRLHHGSTGRRNRNNPGGLDHWSGEHSKSDKNIRQLSHWLDIILSQHIDRPSTPINRVALRLPETIYLKTYRAFYNIAVGSKQLADQIIDGYAATPAFPGSSESIVDHAIECLEDDVSFGISAGHLDRLSDVADFGAGLSLAVAARAGRKYLSNFKLLVNKNMTRESYKHIPMSLLISLGMVAYWGLPPGESADAAEIPDDIMELVNKLLVEQYNIDRGLGAVALAHVPAGSRPEKRIDPITKKLVSMRLKPTYIGSFMYRCKGGIVIANRVGNEIKIGNFITTEGKSRGDLVDEVNLAHATQGANLAGVPVSFQLTSRGSEDSVKTVFPENAKVL